jgi:hypothetical protein
LPTPLPRVRWGERLHEASCVIWQVRSQLFGRRSLAAFVGRGTIGLGGSKSCKGGDMACIRGPLGACVAIYRKVGDREGPLLALEAVPLCSRASANAVEGHRNRLIKPRTGRVDLQTNPSSLGFFACQSASQQALLIMVQYKLVDKLASIFQRKRRPWPDALALQ